MPLKELKSRLAKAGPLKVKAYSRPSRPDHEARQKYFWKGMKQTLGSVGGTFELIPVSHFPFILLSLRRALNSYKINRIISKIMDINNIRELLKKKEGVISSPSSNFHDLVGQYIFNISGKETRVCIDMVDYKEIACPRLLEWSDIYFKSNYWNGIGYPEKVFPIFYANPGILGYIDYLRSLRDSEKVFDLCFVVRVWGGTNEIDGIEHNLRLLEAVSRMRCKKFMYAYLVSGDTGEIAARCDRMGIPWGLKPVPVKKLWRITARSRVSIIRLGMHYCIPWRMFDLLAMGSCPVFDSNPYALWPQALVEGENFLSLHADWCDEVPVLPTELYKGFPEKIHSWLEDEEKLRKIRMNNGMYFDMYLDPPRIAAHMIGTILSCSAPPGREHHPT